MNATPAPCGCLVTAGEIVAPCDLAASMDAQIRRLVVDDVADETDGAAELCLTLERHYRRALREARAGTRPRKRRVRAQLGLGFEENRT